jgi:hypothetical protein
MLADIAKVDLDLAAVTGFSVDHLADLLDTDDDPVIEHDDVPATAAQYAETPEQEEARGAKLAAYEPKFAAGSTEMVLVYAADDRAEVGRLVGAARETLGGDLKASEAVLRALRVLVAVLDARDDPTPVVCANLAKHAGWTGGDE